VSRAEGAGGAAADGVSSEPELSADGLRVAFRSAADNLSAEDANGVNDVFVRDLRTDAVTLASRADGPGGPGADANVNEATISADGRHVAFESDADNLSAIDVNAFGNIFVRDLQAATTDLVSRAAGAGGVGADGGSGGGSVSADGRYVAFQSVADNLSAEDDDAVEDIFRRDVLGPPPASGPAPVGAAPTTRAPTARCAGRRATIVGTGRRDVIRGTARRDVIAALAGNDLVRGLGGPDLVCLGPGADRGVGGAGADRILGQGGADLLEGGRGRDLLQGAAEPTPAQPPCQSSMWRRWRSE
jgi:Ca2+-binding RTX toxin-like protein